MRGQIQKVSNASQYDRDVRGFQGSLTAGDAADAAMTRWLQSAGLQHLASPSVDPRHFSNPIAQDSARDGRSDERKKLFQLIRSISGGLETANQVSTPPRCVPRQMDGIDRLPTTELHREIGGGILDLHSFDDNELLTEDVVHKPFEVSPFVAVTEKGFEKEPEAFLLFDKLPHRQKIQSDNSSIRGSIFEKEVPAKDTSAGLARIKVVVRKRPLNKKEIARKEEDIVIIDSNGSSLAVHEPKLKVDLTAYVERHDFVFDAVLDEQVSNDEVYRETVQPIIPTIFQRTKATCFAYGQTGSGKTFTMQPLPLRACQDMLDLMLHPMYRNEGLQLWLSFFEIYGGKLYDLLSDRRKLCMREDGRQQVCIVGLKEFPVSNVEIVKEYIEKGSSSRSTGSTGANEESSRSHAILQLVVKKHSNKKDEKMGKLVGKFSFIDLAGSERGADTTDNDRQTRIEGAEINKSLLALKECIRALDHEQGHIPFRGSKLTEVLRDSFVGDSRTVMISCISPSTGSCEHTLNTLRYADRVKGLSKNVNAKRDPNPNVGLQIQRETVANSSTEVDNSKDFRVPEPSKNSVDQVNWHTQAVEQNNWASYQGLTHLENVTSSSFVNERDRHAVKESVPSLHYQRLKDDKPDRLGSDLLNNDNITTRGKTQVKEKIISHGSQLRSKDYSRLMASQSEQDGHISAILEEEEDLIAAHRIEVEETMELVREEMRLLTEMDQPGSRVDRYVSQLSYLLSRKAAGIVNLQTQLARFQRHLKEQEVMSQYR